MSHLSYEESKKLVVKGLILLGIITLVEVFIALLGKGYIIHDFHLPRWIMYLLMISMSLYKAYFIVYFFMHMKYEVPGLVKSVLMPTLLLVWAVIAFFSEGKTWREWRALKNDRTIASLQVPAIHKEEHNTKLDEGHTDSKSEEHKESLTPIDTTHHESSPNIEEHKEKEH
ncbi:MAG: cytochrome C oxidase subunit IV family protein [Saprospiraceae bacterium]